MSTKRIVSRLLLSAAVAAFLAVPRVATAGHLDAPQNVTCEVVGDEICVEWDPVEGAVKYSVDAVAFYEDENGEIIEVEASFGTSDREDGGEMGDPNLCIPLPDAEICEEILDEDGNVVDTVCAELVAVWVKVKALDPGRGKGRQNHPFSDWCEVDLGG